MIHLLFSQCEKYTRTQILAVFHGRNRRDYAGYGEDCFRARCQAVAKITFDVHAPCRYFRPTSLQRDITSRPCWRSSPLLSLRTLASLFHWCWRQKRLDVELNARQRRIVFLVVHGRVRQCFQPAASNFVEEPSGVFVSRDVYVGIRDSLCSRKSRSIIPFFFVTSRQEEEESERRDAVSWKNIIIY